MSNTTIEYANSLVLAPMVRCGTLPMRLMALRHGAHLVFGPEEIDKKMIHWKRVENNFLGTVDFVNSKTNLVDFRLSPEEKSRLVFQIGSADPELALQAARIVENDVAGIDLNCGCPKSFSLSGGMGAGLLSTPDLLCSILENLVQNLSIPVTCKIRLITPHADTIALVKKIEATGVKAITLHARTKQEEYKTKAHWDMFKPIREAVAVPLIVNGDLWDAKDVNAVRDMSGVTSFMFARAPEANPTIFRHLRSAFPLTPSSPLPLPSEILPALPILDAIKEYLLIALQHDMPYQNIKYVVLQMFRQPVKSEQGRMLLKAQSQRELAVALDMLREFDEIIEARSKRADEISANSAEEGATREVVPPAVSTDSAAYDALLPQGYKVPRQRQLPSDKLEVLATPVSLLPAEPLKKRERSSDSEEEKMRRRKREEEVDLDTGLLLENDEERHGVAMVSV